MRVAITKIIVGERRRKEMGDLKRFAKSLERYGLIHPLVVDQDMLLVCGGRRLAAAKHLGWTHVEVRVLEELSEVERREIELEENKERKALTAAESSAKLIEEAKEAAKILRTRAETTPALEAPELEDEESDGDEEERGEGFLLEANKNPGGRPRLPNGDVQVAEFLRVSQSTLSQAKSHVAAIEKYPLLGGPEVSQKQALELAKELDKLPEGDAPRLLALVEGVGMPWPKVAEAIVRLVGMRSTTRQGIYRLSQAETQREQSLALTLLAGTGASPDPQLMRVQDMRDHLKRAANCANWCLRNYGDDPWALTLRGLVEVLRGMDAELQGTEDLMQEASRRAYDAALQQEETALAATPGVGEGNGDLHA